MVSEAQDDKTPIEEMFSGWPQQRVVVIRQRWWIRSRGRSEFRAVRFRWWYPRHWWAWFEQWRFERKYW